MDCALGMVCTKHAQPEESLPKALQEMAKLSLQYSPDPCFIRHVDSDTLMYTNEACGCLFGYTEREMLGQRTCLFFTPEERDKLCVILRNRLKFHKDGHPCTTKDGRIVYVLFSRTSYNAHGAPSNRKGSPTTWQLVRMTDITFLREREQMRMQALLCK